MGVKTHYLVSYTGGGFFGWVVKLKSGPYSHSALLKPDKTHVVDVNWYHRLKIRHLAARKGSYELTPLQLDVEKVESFIKKYLDTPYDKKGVISFIVPWIKHDPRFFYCSEFMRDLIYGAGDYPELEAILNEPTAPTKLKNTVEQDVKEVT